MNWRNENKYSRWYDALIEKARQRKHLEKPYERHHVWPIALGGNRKSETVRLTWKEHFLAHWLLVNFAATATGRDKMRYALEQMCWINGTNDARIVVSSWRYEIARKLKLEAIANREPHKHTEEFKRALSLRNKGNKYGKGKKGRQGIKHTPDALIKISNASLLQWETATAEQIRARNTKISASLKGHACSDETKGKIGDKTKGRLHSTTTREKMSAAKRGKTRPPMTEETRSKISASAKRRWMRISEEDRQKISRKDWSHSNETRARISATSRARWASQEFRDKMSAAKIGRKHSEETRRKIGAGNRGKQVSAETRLRMGLAAKKRWDRDNYANPS